MSLSFSTNSTVLAQWGFSAGDIAAMAGAGRAVGTWVMAQARDRTLLEFMRIDASNLIARKGLIDRFTLHERWDAKLILLQNGRKRVIKPPGQKAVENLDSFTWLMALVVASLDSAVSLKTLRIIMRDFLTALFGDHQDGIEFLLHELPRHIEGWLSIATVRGISARARQEWKYLADRGVHESGLIPESDAGEISRLLAWIAGSKEQSYETSSGDAFAIAVVLQVIGLELLSTEQEKKDHDENRIVIRLAKDPIGKIPRKPYWQLGQRWGMRVPLDSMQECVSLWPGTAGENNERRKIFEDGMHAAEGMRLVATRPGFEDSGQPALYYDIILEDESQQIGRVDSVVYRLASSCFPATTKAIVSGLHPLAEKLKRSGAAAADKDLLNKVGDNPSLLAEYQTFVMGFYYSFLRPLLDTSQLSMPQAFGSWSWYDLNLLFKINHILQKMGVPGSNTLRYFKYGILRLLAIFFAGVEEDQVPLIMDGVVGVLGKLSLVSASLLGDVDSWEKASKFFLIDVDPSCIPCTSRGIVTSTRRYEGLKRMVSDSNTDTRVARLAEIDLSGTGIDFTSHIEPDWEFDIQLCRLAFRYKGRLIRQLSPLDCECGVLEDSPYPLGMVDVDSERPDGMISTRALLDTVLIPRSLHDWTNNFVIGPYGPSRGFDEDRPPTVIATKGRSRARTCFRAWYWRNGYHKLPTPNPYRHLKELKDCQVLWASDDINDGPGSDMLLESVSSMVYRAPGRHLILA